MSYLKPKFRHPESPKNTLGYTLDYYEGSLSTLCAGCGHDSISASVVQACYEPNYPASAVHPKHLPIF
jgi:2-oxoglutarate/2-oxoacid ferredoxin oxidoreductase subunit beta